MKKLLKRFGAAFVIVAMLVAMIPMTVLAKQDDKEDKDTHLLTIIGSGSVTDSGVYPNEGKDKPSYDSTNGKYKFNLRGGDHINKIEIDTTSKALTIKGCKKNKSPEEDVITITFTPSPSDLDSFAGWFYENNEKVETPITGSITENENVKKIVHEYGIIAKFNEREVEVINAPLEGTDGILPVVIDDETFEAKDQKLIKDDPIVKYNNTAVEGVTFNYAVVEKDAKVETEDWKELRNDIVKADAGEYDVWQKNNIARWL